MDLQHVAETKVRNFGIALAIFVLVVGVFRWWRRGEDYLFYYVLLSFVLLLVALLAPGLLRPVYDVWMRIAHLILWVNTVILLSLFFFLMVTAVALIFRLLGKRTIDDTIEKEKVSYWIRRPDRTFDRERFKRLF